MAFFIRFLFAMCKIFLNGFLHFQEKASIYTVKEEERNSEKAGGEKR